LAIAGLVMLAVAPTGARAADAPAKAAEAKGGHDTANVKLVKAFIGAWTDPAKAAEYLSDKAVVRMEEDKPATTGRQPFIDAWKGYFHTGNGIAVKFLDTYARGPVVVTNRIDTLTSKDKPDQPFPVVGVFVVKDGKIVEWTDYLNK
jgi:limonene-1,2-epoxide hydrolase